MAARKSREAFRTISEVSEWLDTPAHVLRFWESRFTQVKPVKRAGGRRYYRPNDMLLLGGIKKLLHEDGMTIRGAQKLIREEGVKHVCTLSIPLERGAEEKRAPKPKARVVKEEPPAETAPATPQGLLVLEGGMAQEQEPATTPSKPEKQPQEDAQQLDLIPEEPGALPPGVIGLHEFRMGLRNPTIRARLQENPAVLEQAHGRLKALYGKMSAR